MATDHFGKEDCEGMNLTPDELKRLGSALKDKRFRELLFEYAEELNDPANRRQYEEDIIALEKERGINAIFIHPKAGYVLKTTSGSTKQTKVFLNMCENENVNKPSCYRSMRDNKIKGLQWNIPHLLAPPRKDVDKRGNSCMVYDVVFNPDTLYMAQKNKNFRTMIQEIAMKSVEDKFSVHLDQQNLHYSKMKYKGQPVPTIIRNKHEFVEASGNNKSDSPALCLKSIQSSASGNESEVKDTSVVLNSCGSDTMDLDEKTVKNNIKLNVENSSSCSMPYSKMENILDNMHFADVNKENNSLLVPKYSILYRNYRDFEDYSIIPGKLISTQPKEIIITVELPLLYSTDDIELDVMKDSITLKSKKSGPQYHLQLQLPYSIDEDKGSAKFDRTKHNLIITLLVLQSDEYFSLTEDSNLNLVKDSTESWHGENECDSNLNSMNMSDFPSDINLDDIHQCQDKHSGKEEQCSLILHQEERENSFEEYCVKDANEGHNCGLISKSSCTYLYTIPDFEYHQTSDMLILIIYVKNVEPQSIRTQCCQECCIWQMTFSTLGTGFVPFHYSLVLPFEDPCLAFDVEDESSMIDVNDNTVLWKLKKSQMLHGMWTYFFAGVDQQNLKKYYMASEIGTLARLKSLKDVTEDILCTSEVLDGSKVSIIDVTEKVVTFDIQVGPEINENKCETHLDSTNTNSCDSDQYKNGSVYNTEILFTLSDEVKQIAKDEIQDDPVDSLCSLKTIKSTQKIRTSSESSEDQSPIRRRRGILKYSDKSCRTVSESSDDFLWSSQDISSSDFDFLVDSSTDRIKKSVRFSDYVSKNVYRVNSSILGQRKKNQRKALNKQKSRSRKDSMSSSDSECMDAGDKDIGKGTKMENTTKRSISDTDLFDERIVCAENKGKQKCETQNVESCISETSHSLVDPSGVEDEVEDETTKDLVDKKCVSVDGFFDQEVLDSTSFHITNHEDWTVVTRKKRNGRRRNSNEAKDYDIGNICNKETFNLTSSQRKNNDVKNTANADEKNLQNFCVDNGKDREENISDEKNNVESHVDGAEGRDYILNDSTDRKQSSCSIEHLEDKLLDSQLAGNQDHKYYKCTPTNSLVEDNYLIKYTEDVSSSSDIECNQLKSCPSVEDEKKTMFTEEIKNMVSSENHEKIHGTDDNDTGDDCCISCVPSEPTVCDITQSSVLPICENRTVTDDAIQEEEDVTVGSETVLKWNMNSSKICSYSTHCNIQFSNNLMYQLD
ncbi:PIH1 domain-containing protein Nop17-like [Tachypleus tridentatus]|uniref:PIH1 domain-containing protein Nop17-like n=1 Tax=Tachypleus tridentatus TaxID=6853 RepID=UPI003FCF83B2